MKRPKLIFDIAMLAVYLAAANPAITGIPLHEYVGVGAFLVMAAHVLLSAAGLAGRGRRTRLLLNGALLLSLAACVASGVMVSGTVLPALGLYATGYYFWNPLHALSAKVLLAGLLVHVVLQAPLLYRRSWRCSRRTQQAESPLLEELR